MRAIFAITVLLTLPSPCQVFAQSPRPKYTTLVVEFVGEMDRPVPPVVISTSQEEGNWYKQHPLAGPGQFIVSVEVVPPSVLNEIAELPLLKRALESAKPLDDEPKTRNNVRFTTGVGHHHVQIIVDAQTSSKILKDILRIVDKYPDLKSELQEIDDHVRP
jgi:hypothetical protein